MAKKWLYKGNGRVFCFSVSLKYSGASYIVIVDIRNQKLKANLLARLKYHELLEHTAESTHQ
jgi:hypothetical protein